VRVCACSCAQRGNAAIATLGRTNAKLPRGRPRSKLVDHHQQSADVEVQNSSKAEVNNAAAVDDSDGYDSEDHDHDDGNDGDDDDDDCDDYDDGDEDDADAENVDGNMNGMIIDVLPYCVCLLFMAHAGVNQMALWERWYASASQDERDRIHVVWWMDVITDKKRVTCH
jgi:hypothetical protein